MPPYRMVRIPIVCTLQKHLCCPKSHHIQFQIVHPHRLPLFLWAAHSCCSNNHWTMFLPNSVRSPLPPASVAHHQCKYLQNVSNWSIVEERGTQTGPISHFHISHQHLQNECSHVMTEGYNHEGQVHSHYKLFHQRVYLLVHGHTGHLQRVVHLCKNSCSVLSCSVLRLNDLPWLENPSCLHATLASRTSQRSSQIEP